MIGVSKTDQLQLILSLMLNPDPELNDKNYISFQILRFFIEKKKF